MLTIDQIKNFAKGILLQGYSAAATTISFIPGDGAKFPDPTSGAFNVVWWNATDYDDPADDPQVEIVRFVAGAGDVKTILRGQELTLATAKNVPNKTYKMVLSLTTKMIYDIITQAGTVTGGTSEGAGVPVFRSATSTAQNLHFKSLTAGANVTLTDNGTSIEIASTGGGGPGGTPIAARAYKSAATQSIPVTTSTKVTLDVESFDTGGNIAASRFTATTAGYYQVNASIGYGQADTEADKYYACLIYKNGTPYTETGFSNSLAAASIVASASDIMYLDVGDYVELFAYQNGTGAVLVSNDEQSTFLSISTLGAVGGGGAGYNLVENNATPVTARTTLNLSTLLTASDVAAKTFITINTVNLANDNTFITTLAANNTFVNALVANNTFINALTSNSTFQTNVNNFVSGGSGGGGGLSKPLSFSLVPSDVSAACEPLTGFSDQEAIVFRTNSPGVIFVVRNTTGYMQSRDLSLDWATAANIFAYVVLGNFVYMFAVDSGTGARVYRYDLNDISTGGTLMTFSGASLIWNAGSAGTAQNFACNGTDFYFNYDSGNSNDDSDIAKFTLSGTTFTYVATLAVGTPGDAFGPSWGVTADEHYVGYSNSANEITMYDSAAVLTYTSGFIQSDSGNQHIFNWENTFYYCLSASSRNTFVKLYLPDTTLTPVSDGSAKRVGVGEIGDIEWFNTQLLFDAKNGASSSDWSIWDCNNLGGSSRSVTFRAMTNQGFICNNAADYQNLLPDFNDVSYEYRFTSTKQMIFQIDVVTFNAGVNDFGAGFGCEVFGGSQLRNAYGVAAPYGFGFVRRETDGQWYAHTSNGVTFTETAITVTNAMHTFRCEYDPGNAVPQVRFYVDGAIVATITTNLPTAQANPLGFSIGNNSSVGSGGIQACSAPSFAVEK